MSKKPIGTREMGLSRCRQILMTRQCMSFTSGMHLFPYPFSEGSFIFGNSQKPRPFQDAVRAGTGNIMCSYQRINNSYGCANSKTMNGLLKTELGFQGFVVSDWGAQHAGVATALSGMDMAMPGAGDFWGEKLKEAVKNGTIPESRITDMAMR